MASEQAVEEKIGNSRGQNSEECADIKRNIAKGSPGNNSETDVPTEITSNLKQDAGDFNDGSSEEDLAPCTQKATETSSNDAVEGTISSVEANAARSQAASEDIKTIEQVDIIVISQLTASENTDNTNTELESLTWNTDVADIEKAEFGNLPCNITEVSGDEETELGTSARNTEHAGDGKTEMGNSPCNTEEKRDVKIQSGNSTCNSEEKRDGKTELGNSSCVTEEKSDEKTELGNSSCVTEEKSYEKTELGNSPCSNEEECDVKRASGNSTCNSEEKRDGKTELGNSSCIIEEKSDGETELGNSPFSTDEKGDRKITELGDLPSNTEEIGDNKTGMTKVTNSTEETTNNDKTELANEALTAEEAKELVNATRKTEKARKKAHAGKDVNKINYNVEAEIVDEFEKIDEITNTFQIQHEDTMRYTDCLDTSAYAPDTGDMVIVQDISGQMINAPVPSFQSQDTRVTETGGTTLEVALAVQDAKANLDADDTVAKGLETSASSEINHSAYIHPPTEERMGERDGVVILNLQPDDLINLRLSQLSDISEENDTQLDAESGGSGDKYQVVESVVVQDALDAGEPSVSAGDEEKPCKCRDTAVEVTYNTMDSLCPGDTSPNGKGDCPSESCSERISTEAVIENTGTESGSDRVDGGEQVTLEDRESLLDDLPTDEEQRLLVPKAECDSIDLMDEDETSIQNEPLPDAKDSQLDPKASSGVQRVAKAFIQTRYKNMSKKRRFYTTVMKYILFFFNFKCWVAGASATIAGSWMIAEKRKMVRDALDFFLDPAIILCVSGTIIFIVAFFGFVGALRENILLLKIWHISLSLFLVAELIFGALVFIFYFFPGIRRDLNLAPEDWGLKEAIRKYKDDKGMRDWIDMVQREMKCCGVTNSDNGYKDWQDNVYYKCTDENPSPERCAVPPSCCIIEPGDYYNSMCGYNTNNKEVWEVEMEIYTQGCVQGFGKWLQRHAVLICAVFAGIVIPQFIGIVMARVYIKLTTTKQVQSRWKTWKVKSLARVTGDSSAKATDV